MNKNGFWNTERDARVLELWPSMSGAQIAEELGTSRNAVIARYYRLKGHTFASDRARRELNREDLKQKIAERNRMEQDALKLLDGNLRGKARQAAIKAAAQSGARLAAIAKVLGITTQRVCMIRAYEYPR